MRENNNKSNTELIEIISLNCLLKKLNDKLEIHIDLSHYSKFYRDCILIFGGCSIFFFIFLEFGQIIQGFIYLFIQFLIIIPFVFGYLYYKNQKREWIFDKSSQIVKFLKKFSHFEKVKTFSFSEIKSLIYKSDPKYMYSKYYNLSVFLKKNKRYKIYIGEKFACEELGNKLSKFIEIVLNYKSNMRIYYE